MKNFALAAVLTLSAGAAVAEGFDPAPSGEPAVVAQGIIQRGFKDCGLVIAASRLGDGSILARCKNDETFRVFSIRGKEMAIRCSALRELTSQGCT